MWKRGKSGVEERGENRRYHVMTSARQADEFVSYVEDLLQTVGPVRARRMFGGHGFFLEGLMFALVVDNTLYLKADADTVGDFESRGLEAFSYRKQGKWCSIAYYQIPEEALEDIEEMRLWANKAYAVALRAAAAARHRRTRRKGGASR